MDADVPADRSVVLGILRTRTKLDPPDLKLDGERALGGRGSEDLPFALRTLRRLIEVATARGAPLDGLRLRRDGDTGLARRADERHLGQVREINDQNLVGGHRVRL